MFESTHYHMQEIILCGVDVMSLVEYHRNLCFIFTQYQILYFEFEFQPTFKFLPCMGPFSFRPSILKLCAIHLRDIITFIYGDALIIYLDIDVLWNSLTHITIYTMQLTYFMCDHGYALSISKERIIYATLAWLCFQVVSFSSLRYVTFSLGFIKSIQRRKM